MVQQKSLEAHQLKTYTTFLKFFQDSMGITRPLRGTVPHKEIHVELTLAKKKGFKEIGKELLQNMLYYHFFPHNYAIIAFS